MIFKLIKKNACIPLLAHVVYSFFFSSFFVVFSFVLSLSDMKTTR